MPANGQGTIFHQQQNSIVSDIIGKAPSWLLRSGITMLAFAFTIIITISSFIQYPDKIKGAGILTSSTPPIELVSQTQGYIENVLINNGQKVTANEQLFYIKNTTNPVQINIFNDWLDDFEAIKESSKYLNISIPKNLQLGVLQNDYAALLLKFNEIQQTLKSDIPLQQINNISEEIIKIRSLNQSQQKEKVIYINELTLEEKNYNRNIKLEQQGLISTQEMEQNKMKYLQKLRHFESMENAIIQNKIRIQQLELEKLKIEEDRANLVKSYQFEINEIIVRIQSNIEEWNQTYIIESPLDGIVSLKTDYHQNSFIQPDDVLGYIIPHSDKEKYFLCEIPIFSAGKLEVDQKAIIKLDAFPPKEYGLLICKVDNISRIPAHDKDGNAFYKVKIPIEDTTYTDTGSLIPYKPNMTAQVEIITEDKTILQRIFNQFLSLIKQQES